MLWSSTLFFLLWFEFVCSLMYHKNEFYQTRSWEEKSRTKDGVSCVRTHVRMEACKEEKIDFKAVQEMWGDFLPLLMDTEDLIAQYKG